MGGKIKKNNLRSSRILAIQEEERGRIARDIHDGLGQSLSAIKLKCELVKERLKAQDSAIKHELGEIALLLLEALQDLSRICFDLQPLGLEDSGLISALSQYIESFARKTGIKVDFDHKGVEKLLPPGQAVQIFRIVQEALHNVWKHSQADRASVSVEYSDSTVYIVIIDNGIGFDIKKLNEDENGSFSGRGLVNIKERVNLLNGRFHLSSQPGKGTETRIEIPYEMK